VLASALARLVGRPYSSLFRGTMSTALLGAGAEPSAAPEPEPEPRYAALYARLPASPSLRQRALHLPRVLRCYLARLCAAFTWRYAAAVVSIYGVGQGLAGKRRSPPSASLVEASLRRADGFAKARGTTSASASSSPTRCGSRPRGRRSSAGSPTSPPRSRASSGSSPTPARSAATGARPTSCCTAGSGRRPS